MSEPIDSPTEVPRSRGWLMWLPLIAFAALAAIFWFQLGSGDPSRIPSALIGHPVPQTSLPPLQGLLDDGAPVPGLDPATFKGKVSLVNVWASWCIPCHEEAPLLTELARDKRLQLIGINYKDAPDNARRFLGRYGNPFGIVGVDGNGRAAIEWGVYGVPETFVVGREAGGSELIHYSAAGKMLGTLADPGQYVISCSVDALGDVAASNIISTSGGAGSVSIWTAGRGSPTNYPVAGLARVYFIGYDPHGNLFVDGSDDSGIFALAELAKGAPAFKPLTVSGATINFPGGVQYAYGALAIGDQSGPSGNAVIYQTQVSGSTAKVVGTTRLKNAGDVVEFCITRSKTVIAPGSYGLQIFTYPAGGGPIRSISAGPGQELAGCAIVY
jgi:cytochrome c biogenesis protein CcmG/thiol:disulfide interchange protein DsbE